VSKPISDDGWYIVPVSQAPVEPQVNCRLVAGLRSLLLNVLTGPAAARLYVGLLMTTSEYSTVYIALHLRKKVDTLINESIKHFFTLFEWTLCEIYSEGGS